MKIEAFLILIPLSLSGCFTDMGEQLPDPEPVSADSVSSISIQGRSVYFNVICTIPTPCYVFVRSDYSISGQLIPVKVYARPRNNDPCIQMLARMEAQATIVVPSSGSYTFQFWRYGGQTLDTSLTFQ